MRIAAYLLSLTKLPLSVAMSNAGKANVSVLLTGLLLLLFSDGLSISSAGYLDASELIALTDGFLFDCVAASFCSLLLTNPIVIEQLWRLISYIVKLINRLNLVFSLPTLLVPQRQVQLQAAHGCRAPPLLTHHF